MSLPLLKKQKILVILGPTASGKSDLAVQIARKFNGEIISADSRQVYKGLDIGSGKITRKEMRGVPHHMLDVVSPRTRFTVAQFKSRAEKIISEIAKRGKLPIICGGTGFYIDALIYDFQLPEVGPNKKLREKLEAESLESLQKILQKLDPERFENIDQKNKVRLVRAIEIATALGKVPKLSSSDSRYNALLIGVDWPNDILKKRIHDRLLARIKKGMIAETKKLHTQGISWKRLESFGLEYRYTALYLQNKISKEEMLTQLETKIGQFAKRQRTWFKRNKMVQWFKPIEIAQIKNKIRILIK